MKRYLFLFIASMLHSLPVSASPYWLNVQGWEQSDWWQCDDRPGLVRLPFNSPNHMNVSWCVAPSTFIRTSGGGRVRYQKREVWTRDVKIPPEVAHLIPNKSTKGDKFGRSGWIEVDCNMMERRENQLYAVGTTNPRMSSKWSKINWQPDASIIYPRYGWTKMTPITRVKPVDKWICAQ